MRATRRPFTTLIAINAILLGALATIALAPRVTAQSRMRSSYTMTAGGVKGQVMPVVYVVDEGSMELVGLVWDDQSKQLSGIGYRNLASDGADLARSRN